MFKKPSNFISLADRKKKKIQKALGAKESPISTAIGQIFDLSHKPHLRLNSGQIETKAGHVVKLCDPGTPDRVIFDALAIFAEVKQPGESLRPEQVAKVAELKQAGAIVVVLRDPLEAQKLLQIISRYKTELGLIRQIAETIQKELDAQGFDW